MNKFCEDTLNIIDDLTSLIELTRETDGGINIKGDQKEHLDVLYKSLKLYELFIDNLPDDIKEMSK